VANSAVYCAETDSLEERLLRIGYKTIKIRSYILTFPNIDPNEKKYIYRFDRILDGFVYFG
jgi:hypothetical protein